MRSFSIFLFSVLSLFAGLVSAECLVTFNSYGPIYASNVHNRGLRVVEEIKKNDACDLIHFQEAWNPDQINVFEDGLKGQFKIYSPNRQYRIGLMNFSKAPFTDQKVFSYRANYDGDFLDGIRKMVHSKKAFSILSNALPETLTVNTHLHPSSYRVRILQMIDLLNWRVQNSSKLMILTGDFNMEPNSFERSFLMKILDLEDTMTLVKGYYADDFCSYCASNPLSWLGDNHVFDYVFFSHLAGGQRGWVPQDIRLALTGNGQPLSDHYGLKVNFSRGKGPRVVSRTARTKKEMLLFFDAAVSRVLTFDPAIQLGYLPLMQRIRGEIQSGTGPYGRYFAEIFQKH